MSEITLLNIDCMEFMASCKDKEFDLAIVDPNYRDENQPTKDMRRNGSMKTLVGRPTKYYFAELRRVSKEQIIFGANNFQLPQFMGFIVWEKLTISEEFTMSMAEIASLSEGLGTTSKIFKCAPQGKKTDPRIHPTQKPISLYKWLIKNYAKPGNKILDTHGGSMSIAIACHEMGFDLTLCEIDKDYYDAGVKRYKKAIAQEDLFEYDGTDFKIKDEIKQTDLFNE
jgi:site-specific DNA-methyltransferase (adenine-specific)